MISNYVTIDSIIERINRFKLPGGYWNKEEIKEWSYDALEAIGTKDSNIKRTSKLELFNNKAKLPADIFQIFTIFDEYNNKLSMVLPHDELESNTYTINGGFLYTSLEEPNNVLTINYYTVPLDDEGNPLIPDKKVFLSAIEAYLQYMIAKRAYFQGKILERQLLMLEREWLFYLPAAQASEKLDILNDPGRFARIHNKFIH